MHEQVILFPDMLVPWPVLMPGHHTLNNIELHSAIEITCTFCFAVDCPFAQHGKWMLSCWKVKLLAGSVISFHVNFKESDSSKTIEANNILRTSFLVFWENGITANSTQRINHLSSTYISLVWVPSLPLGALHHVYKSVPGSGSVCMATPWSCLVVLLCRSQTSVHIPLLSSVLGLPVYLWVMWLPASCQCSPVLHAGFTGCEYRSPPDGTMPPTTLPSLLPRQQCQLQPVPSISPSLTKSYDIFMVCLSHRSCSWCAHHEDVHVQQGGLDSQAYLGSPI